MIFNFDKISSYYKNLDSVIKKIRIKIDKPLTLTEKILYSHVVQLQEFSRGEEYANFFPDRVAMQDATAQMALLQFMMAGKDKTAVPTSVHADHLIQAKINSEVDLKNALDINSEVFDF